MFFNSNKDLQLCVVVRGLKILKIQVKQNSNSSNNGNNNGSRSNNNRVVLFYLGLNIFSA